MNGFTPGVPGTPGAMPGPQAQQGQQAPIASPTMGYEINMERIKAQAAEVEAHGVSQQRESDFYSFKVGHNFIRCLPPWSQEVGAKGQFTKYSATHFRITPSKLMTPCWETAYPGMGFRCPVCTIRRVFGQHMGEAIKDTSPRTSYACNAVVYDQQRDGTLAMKRTKPYVIKLPNTVWAGLMQMFASPYIGNILDLQSGWIVCVTRPETFEGKNNYTVGQVVQAPLGDPNTIQQVMSQLHNLDKFADLAIPTVEKLQKQFEVARSYFSWVCDLIGISEQQGLPMLNGALDAPYVPPVVQEVHGSAAMAPGLPGGPMPGQQAQAAAPSFTPPAPSMPVASPPPMAGPAPMPSPAPAAVPVTAPPGAAPGMPAPAMPMPTMPGAPVPPMGPPPMPAPASSPQTAPPAFTAPNPQIPNAQPPQAPQAPAPQVPTGGQGNQPFPFPQAPAPQEEETPPTSERSGEGQGDASGKVKCPGCGKEYKRLKAHLAKSPECQKAAGEAPVAMADVPQEAPASVPQMAPVGMAPPDWGETGPLQ